MLCKRCGTEVSDDGNFCQKCGQAVSSPWEDQKEKPRTP
ncbi:zinc-ribbon domain-containing protein, partial [Vibrio cholerae]|nr:zinc-ribbon domain-containing protein [Vibrio cholerae]